MCLRWIKSPSDYVPMRASFEKFGEHVFRALAQLIFTDKPLAGFLVLAAIALISPWSAVGAVVGAVCGNASHLLLGTYAKSAWRAGVAGFNCAVIGILWSGFPAAGEPSITLLAGSLAVCVVVEAVAQRVLSRVRLPVLVLPAILTAMALSLVLAGPSSWLWMETNAVLGELGLALAIVCVIVALGLDSPRNAVPVVVLGGSAALLATMSMGSGVLATAGLWAFTVAPAVLAMQMLCFGPTVRSVLAGIVAASIGATLWVVWSTSAAMSWAPPLLLPYVLGVWVAIALGRLSANFIWFSGAFWRTLGLLWTHTAEQRRITVLTGDITVAHPRVGTSSTHGWTSINTHARPGVSEWDACDQARQILGEREPTAVHLVLMELERQAFVDHTFTTAQDTCFERAGGINVTHLHGTAGRTVCTGCKRSDQWPPGRLWRLYTLRCGACGALLEPALLDRVRGAAADRASETIEETSVLLVVEPDAQSRELLRILDMARSRGARVVIIKERRTRFCVSPADIVLNGAIGTSIDVIRRLLLLSRRFARAKRGRDVSEAVGPTPS